MNAKGVVEHIVGWLRSYAKGAGSKGFVVGVSGGIDSAVTSALCAQTGKPTLIVDMPIYQDETQVSRGMRHILSLKSRYENFEKRSVELTSVFDSLIGALPDAPDSSEREMSLVNARARLRMTTLYYFAGLEGKLVVGTGNKVEDFGVGFYTKYGDGGVDISPIADLMKTEVYALAREMNVTKDIVEARPTDGLFGDTRSDEDQIGASYD